MSDSGFLSISQKVNFRVRNLMVSFQSFQLFAVDLFYFGKWVVRPPRENRLQTS